MERTGETSGEEKRERGGELMGEKERVQGGVSPELGGVPEAILPSSAVPR